MKKDIDDLKKDMTAFQWKVDTLLYKNREESLPVLSDMDVAEVRVDGPSFAEKPVRVFDDFDDTLVIDKPGEYYLRGAYQLNVRTPNPSLGGRPIAVEMQATLTPAD